MRDRLRLSRIVYVYVVSLGTFLVSKTGRAGLGMKQREPVQLSYELGSGVV